MLIYVVVICTEINAAPITNCLIYNLTVSAYNDVVKLYKLSSYMIVTFIIRVLVYGNKVFVNEMLPIVSGLC